MPVAYVARMLCHRGNTMRNAHLSIWAAIAGAGLSWRDSSLHGLCQPCCLQIYLAPLPAPTTKTHLETPAKKCNVVMYIWYVQQPPKVMPIIPLSGMCGFISRTRHWSCVHRSSLYSFARLHNCSRCNKQGTCSKTADAVMLSIRRGHTGGPHRVGSARWR